MKTIRNTLEGWTIVSVNPSDKAGHRWRMELRQGARTRVVYLGCDTRGVPFLGHVTDGDNVFLDFEQLVEAVQDHVLELSQEDAEMEHTTLKAVDDVLNLRLGFQCPLTGTEFWCHVKHVRDSQFRDRMSTEEGRAKLAGDLWNMRGVYREIYREEVDND